MQKFCATLSIIAICGLIVYACVMSLNFPNYNQSNVDFHIDKFTNIFDGESKDSIIYVINNTPLANFEFTGLFSFLNVFLVPLKLVIKIIGIIGYVLYWIGVLLFRFPSIFAA